MICLLSRHFLDEVYCFSGELDVKVFFSTGGGDNDHLQPRIQQDDKNPGLSSTQVSNETIRLAPTKATCCPRLPGNHGDGFFFGETSLPRETEVFCVAPRPQKQ